MGLNATAALELSELRMYVGGVIADGGYPVTSTTPPDAGSMGLLVDGDALGVVSWAYEKHTAPGFAFKWDMGVAVEPSHFRLGSGSSADSWPLTLSVQSSDDNATWYVFRGVYGIKYPGPNALTEAPIAGGTPADPHDSLVTSSILGTVDLEDTQTAQTGSFQTAFGGLAVGANFLPGVPAIEFNGSTHYLTLANSTGFKPGTGAFCFEGYVSSSSLNTNYQILVDTSNNGSAFGGMFLEYSTRRGIYWAQANGAFSFIDHPAAASDGLERHIFISRDAAGKMLLGYGGTIVKVKVVALDNIQSAAGGLSLGAFYGGVDKWRGTLRGFKFTQGHARYAGNAGDTYPLPAISTSSGTQFIPRELSGLLPKRWKTVLPSASKFAGLDALGYAISLTPQPIIFADVYNGGQGRVLGTVKEKTTPTNTHLRRRVLLMDERSQVVIRQTWSDAVTGDYEFPGIDENAIYTVTSYDHTGTYRAVIADGQTAVLI